MHGWQKHFLLCLCSLQHKSIIGYIVKHFSVGLYRVAQQAATLKIGNTGQEEETSIKTIGIT